MPVWSRISSSTAAIAFGIDDPSTLSTRYSLDLLAGHLDRRREFGGVADA